MNSDGKGVGTEPGIKAAKGCNVLMGARIVGEDERNDLSRSHLLHQIGKAPEMTAVANGNRHDAMDAASLDEQPGDLLGNNLTERALPIEYEAVAVVSHGSNGGGDVDASSRAGIEIPRNLADAVRRMAAAIGPDEPLGDECSVNRWSPHGDEQLANELFKGMRVKSFGVAHAVLPATTPSPVSPVTSETPW